MNRHERRSLKKKVGEETFNAVSLMLSMPEECSGCQKKFDKKDKEMAKTWMVQVYQKKNAVDLKCPECWQQIVEKHTKKEEMPDETI